MSVMYWAMYGQTEESPASVKQCAWIWKRPNAYLYENSIVFSPAPASSVMSTVRSGSVLTLISTTLSPL